MSTITLARMRPGTKKNSLSIREQQHIIENHRYYPIGDMASTLGVEFILVKNFMDKNGLVSVIRRFKKPATVAKENVFDWNSFSGSII